MSAHRLRLSGSLKSLAIVSLLGVGSISVAATDGGAQPHSENLLAGSGTICYSTNTEDLLLPDKQTLSISGLWLRVGQRIKGRDISTVPSFLQFAATNDVVVGWPGRAETNEYRIQGSLDRGVSLYLRESDSVLLSQVRLISIALDEFTRLQLLVGQECMTGLVLPENLEEDTIYYLRHTDVEAKSAKGVTPIAP